MHWLQDSRISFMGKSTKNFYFCGFLLLRVCVCPSEMDSIYWVVCMYRYSCNTCTSRGHVCLAFQGLPYLPYNEDSFLYRHSTVQMGALCLVHVELQRPWAQRDIFPPWRLSVLMRTTRQSGYRVLIDKQERCWWTEGDRERALEMMECRHNPSLGFCAVTAGFGLGLGEIPKNIYLFICPTSRLSVQVWWIAHAHAS